MQISLVFGRNNTRNVDDFQCRTFVNHLVTSGIRDTTEQHSDQIISVGTCECHGDGLVAERFNQACVNNLIVELTYFCLDQSGKPIRATQVPHKIMRKVAKLTFLRGFADLCCSEQ